MTSEPPVPKPRTLYKQELLGFESRHQLDQFQKATMLWKGSSNKATDTDGLPGGGSSPDPGVDQPGVGYPGVEHPDVGYPDVDPDGGYPDVGYPGVDPDVDYPDVGYPGLDPNAGYPGVDPGIDHPSVGYPGIGYPGVDPDVGYPGGGYPGVDYPGLAFVTDMISSTIPGLSEAAASILSPNPSSTVCCSPIGLDSMSTTKASHTPMYRRSASTGAKPARSLAYHARASVPNLESLLATHIPALAGLVGSVPHPGYGPAVTMTTSSTSSDDKYNPASDAARGTATDVDGLSQLVMAVALSPDEAETESSNEDEGLVTLPTSPGPEQPMGEGLDKPPVSRQQSNSTVPSPHQALIPCRPPPPPPRAPESIKNQKTPRSATIRVSRKKKVVKDHQDHHDVRVSSWLDMWKGFRHSVVFASLDGPRMSLWKKRTDKSSEVVFHMSSVTGVKQQEKARFSVYFGKRHYEFMAHSDAVNKAWISSLQLSRGHASPAPPQHHGPITIKDPKNRVYASVSGQELWVYHNKEDYQVGVAWFLVPLNMASVKPAGKRSFQLITPYRTFSVAVDSTADMSVWLAYLSAVIHSALSSNQVALLLWENPSNKVCGDCGTASPEWASVNLLLLLCQACAGQHRALGTSLSKVRSLTLDSKVWAKPLIQLFVSYGNRVANQIWSPAVPAAEQLLPAASDEERSEFIRNKYSKARYRKPHPLASSPALLYERLCKVVCGEDIEETMSLICSGAKLSCQSDPQNQSALQLAERAGQILQVELLRLNEYTEAPPFLPLSANGSTDDSQTGEEEALHGKLEEDRFLFSRENNSAACDVLDLREVRTVLLRSSLQFVMVSLGDRLICAADNQLELQTHLLHILQVILPVGVSEVDLGGVLAVSRVCLLDAMGCPEGWAVLQAAGWVSVYPSLVQHDQLPPIKMLLDSQTHYEMDPNEHSVKLLTGNRTVHLRFEDDYSCQEWVEHLKYVLANPVTAPQPPVANQNTALHQLKLEGRVPLAVERCVSHITQHGLQVDGLYRRCGLATKVSRLVEALQSRPDSTPLECDEQGILDVCSALKQYVRQQPPLFPPKHRELWAKAAAQAEEPARLAQYRRLLRQMPNDNRATLNALIGHFYMVQKFSSQNQMTAQNLALVLVPTLFQIHHADLVRLTRDLIIHHSLLFLTPGGEAEQITAL